MSPFKFAFGKGNVLPNASSSLGESLDLGEQLGKGHFGVVRACKCKATGEKFACKSISKAKLNCWEEKEDVRREVEIMETLGHHPNLVSLRGTYEDDESVHLVLDCCEGGELFDEISLRGPMTEERAAQVMQGLAKAVGHCHSLGVFHRDLKPENILLVHKPEEQRKRVEVKVADFGLSLMLREGQTVTGLAGSPYYLAPEVLTGSYGQKADIWSMGVILYMMLSETAPFFGDTDAEICDSIAKADLRFNGAAWIKVSEDAKDLIRRMLQRDPSQRPSALEVLQHPWMLQHLEEAAVPVTYIHRSCSSTPSKAPCSTDCCSTAPGLSMHQCQSLPRGTGKASELLQWLSPQLVGASAGKAITPEMLEGSPLLDKFNEALADLEEGVHYFVLDEGKPYLEDCTGRKELRLELELGEPQKQCSPSVLEVQEKGYEPTPADALDWIFGM